MKNPFRNIRQDRLVSRLFIMSLILIVLTVIFILLNYTKLPPLLPIFNQLPWGERRLSETPGIFIPSLVAVFILIMNVIASSFIYPSSPLIARILAVTSFLTSLLTLLFVFRTILLII
jgi:hypothetical protein